MKIKICLFLGLSLFMNQVVGQSFLQQFFQLSAKNDTIGELELLKKWESESKHCTDSRYTHLQRRYNFSI